MRKVILASASPRRKELMERAGMVFTVQKSQVEEAITKTLPREVVEELALQKAEDVYARTCGERVVIGSDTVVALKDQILGKPRDEAEAVSMLSALAGGTHQVYTGVSLVYEWEGKKEAFTFHEATRVSVYPMTKEEILVYVRTGEPMDKAGAYGIQGAFSAYIREIHGDYQTVVGLPLGRLVQEMKRLGLECRRDFMAV